MKSERERMDIITPYNDLGSNRWRQPSAASTTRPSTAVLSQHVAHKGQISSSGYPSTSIANSRPASRMRSKRYCPDDRSQKHR